MRFKSLMNSVTLDNGCYCYGTWYDFVFRRFDGDQYVTSITDVSKVNSDFLADLGLNEAQIMRVLEAIVQ